MYADVFWVLKIYASEALARFARSRNISTYIFGRYISGPCPPPPNTKKLAMLLELSMERKYPGNVWYGISMTSFSFHADLMNS